MPTIVVNGTAGNDTFSQAVGDDPRRYFGLAGNDTYNLRLYDDTIPPPPGGGGEPTVVYLEDEAVEAANGGNDTVYLRNLYNPVGFTGIYPIGVVSASQLANIETIIGVNTAHVVGSTTTYVRWNITAGANNNTITTFDGVDRLDGGSGNDTLSSGAANDTLLGGAGNDFLNGGTGDDTMEGGAGNDIYVVDELATFGGGDFDRVTEAAGGGTDTVQSATNSLALLDFGGSFANVENLGLLGSANLNLTGNSGNNVLTGNSGQNTLNGGAGVDTADYSAKTSAIAVSLNGATAVTVTVGGVAEDTLQNIESVIGGSGNDSINGDSLSNVLNGGGGNDVLNGLGGADLQIGGAGNDVFHFDVAGDAAVEAAGGGTDLVRTLVSIPNLGANIENVQLNGVGNFLIVGNELTNVMNGNPGINQLRGMAGNDFLFGFDGNDVLLGGAGKDQMAGGNGNDAFHFDALADMGNTAATRDIITDFAVGFDDLDFNTMDANTVAAGNQNFVWRGTAALTAAGQLRYIQSGGNTILQGNLDGNLATVEFEVQLNGLKALTAGDIVA